MNELPNTPINAVASDETLLGHTLCDYDGCTRAPVHTTPRGAVLCAEHKPPERLDYGDDDNAACPDCGGPARALAAGRFWCDACALGDFVCHR